MKEDIRQLYKQLYITNYKKLEENRIVAQNEKKNNEDSIISSKIERQSKRRERMFKRKILKLIFRILIPVWTLYMVNDIKTNGMGSPSQRVIKILIIPILFIIIISAVIIKFRRMIFKKNKSVEENLNVKINTTNKENYQKTYCENIFKPIIEKVIPNSEYTHHIGMNKELYENMKYSNFHDVYEATDNIKLKNNNVILSKVHTKFKTSNAAGWWYHTLFCGIASIYKMPFKLPFYIKIRNKKLESLKLNKKFKVELNDEEFNQYYEIETDNKKILEKIFTNRMTQYFIDLVKNKNQNIEVNIIDDSIYLRLEDKDFLEFDIMNEKVNEQRIINACNSIIVVINTHNFITKELKAFDI